MYQIYGLLLGPGTGPNHHEEVDIRRKGITGGWHRGPPPSPARSGSV